MTQPLLAGIKMTGQLQQSRSLYLTLPIHKALNLPDQGGTLSANKGRGLRGIPASPQTSTKKTINIRTYRNDQFSFDIQLNDR